MNKYHFIVCIIFNLILIDCSPDSSKTTYEYFGDGKIRVNTTVNIFGSRRQYISHDGKVWQDDCFDNRGKRHGLCSRYYMRDGALLYKCEFKHGSPHNGIWPFTFNTDNYDPHSIHGKYYKYTKGKKEEIIYPIRKHSYSLTRRYRINLTPENYFHLDLFYLIGICPNCDDDGRGSGNGMGVLKNGRIINYDRNHIKLINSLTFIPINQSKGWTIIKGDTIQEPLYKRVNKPNGWIILEGVTSKDEPFLDSISLKYYTRSLDLISSYNIDTNVTSVNNFRILLKNGK